MENETTITRRELIAAAARMGLILPLAGLTGSASGQGLRLIKAPSIDRQKKLGAQAAQQYRKKYRVVKDGRATHFEEIGRRLIDALPDEDKTRWDYSFTVLDNKEPNAFALPGGPMFLFTGLYKGMETDDGLAGVTGHELTHVRHQHWARATARAQERQLGLGAILGITRANREISSLIAQGEGLFRLKYSRSDEDDADKGGLQNLIDARYNPNGMTEMFQYLLKLSNGKEGADWLSDHPATANRVKKAQERIADYEKNHSDDWPQKTPLAYEKLV